MEKKSIWTKIISAFGVLLVASFMFYELIALNIEPVKTETVLAKTAQMTISTKLFVVRDEQYIMKDISGTVVPLIEDGQKVAKGDVFAMVCADADNAAVFTEINKIKKNILRYEELNSLQNVNAIDINKMNSDIDLLFANMLIVVSSGQYESFNKCAGDFRDQLTSRQIAIDGKLDFSSKISALKEKLAELEAQNISMQSLTAENSGYFISRVDGYENIIPYKDIENVSAADIDNAITISEPIPPANAFGKLVCNYDWYLLATVSTEEATRFKIGETRKIIFGKDTANTVSVTVHSINSSNDGKSAIVFICNQMNGQFAGMRIEEAQIVLKDYNGYKVNSSAIRVIDGVTGVYILRGNVVSFRKIGTLYSQDDYVIAEIIENTSTTKEPFNIELFDEVILGGKDLYEGKIVNR